MGRGGLAGRTRVVSRQLRSRWLHAIGEARQWSRGATAPPACVLLVLGCQRSGTTLMTRLLDGDPDAKVYPEHSTLSAGDRRDGLRLVDFRDLARSVESSRFPLVVMKPLVESQYADRLLEAVPRARALWMFRHWSDVARSNLARFGPDNGVRNLRGLLQARPDDWRAERVSDEVERVVRHHYHDEMGPWDAAALFWWARNHLFFDQALDHHPRVSTCRYEDLVSDPRGVMTALYATIGRPPPRDDRTIEVSEASVGRGRECSFSAAVERLCEEMWERLCRIHEEGSRCA